MTRYKMLLRILSLFYFFHVILHCARYYVVHGVGLSFTHSYNTYTWSNLFCCFAMKIYHVIISMSCRCALSVTFQQSNLLYFSALSALNWCSAYPIAKRSWSLQLSLKSEKVHKLTKNKLFNYIFKSTKYYGILLHHFNPDIQKDKYETISKGEGGQSILPIIY